MALENAVQPEQIPIRKDPRLRRYDGRFELFLPGYRDPVVYQNSEGIFAKERIPDMAYMERMCAYLSKAGELYYIEALEESGFRPIGDVTIKPENPPIAIWEGEYRGRGIGLAVMQAVIARLRELGYPKITGSTVYRWNTASRRLHEKLGFVLSGENEKECIYEMSL